MTISVQDYDPTAPQLFEEARGVLQKLLPDAQIHHVGSTAIPGLGGKGINDVHIHFTYVGSPEYQNMLAFRDYLLAHPEEVINYQKQKHQWLKSASGHRQFYTASKNDYIVKIISHATIKG